MRFKSGTIRSQGFENRRGEGPGDEVVTGTEALSLRRRRDLEARAVQFNFAFEQLIRIANAACSK